MKLNEVLFAEAKQRLDGDILRLEIPFLIANKKNENNRLYPRSVLESALREVEQKLSSGRSMFGAPGHPKGEAEISDVSHIVEKIWMEGDTAKALVKILPTTAGRNLGVIIKAGGKLGISARGIGSVTNKQGIDEVNSDYKLAAVDFVLSPSFGLHAGAENIIESTFQGANLMEEEEISEEEYVALVEDVAKDFEKAAKAKFGAEFEVSDFDLDGHLLLAKNFGGGNKTFFKTSYKFDDAGVLSLEDGLEPHDGDTLPEEPQETTEELLRQRWYMAVRAGYTGTVIDYQKLLEEVDVSPVAWARYRKALAAGYKGTLREFTKDVIYR